MRRHRSGSRLRIAVTLLVLVAAVGLALAASSPTPALTNTRVTLNEETGGLPTRFTFETLTEPGPPIAEATLEFPAEFDLSKARVQALTLEGLNRFPLDVETAVSGQRITMRFDPQVAPKSTLRIQIFDVVTPIRGGEYELGFSYVVGGTTKVEPALPFAYASPTVAEQMSRFLDDQAWVEQFNSVKFLSLFFRPQLIALSVPLLFYGWVYSIALIVVAFPIAIVGGLLLAFAKMSKIPPLRWVAAMYVNVIRGTPLYLQIAVAFIGLRVAGIRVNDFATGVIVLALNSAAYLTEIFRAGIQSIHRGQFEAASSLGMSYWQSMRYVIIPQTIKRVLPTMTSEFILLFKDTALLSAFGIIELMYRGTSIVSRTGNLTPFVVAAVYYLIVTIPLINWVDRLEKRLAVAEGGQAPPPGRPKRGVPRWKPDADDDAMALSAAEHESR